MDLPVNPPVAPMLAKAVGEIPDGPYSFEPKWDGFRAIVFRDGGEVEIGSRNERPMTRYFPELVRAITAELPERCVVDGEIVIPDKEGRRLDFEALLQRIHPAVSRINLLAEQTPAHFVAFDLLAAGDEDYTGQPFARRREALEQAWPARAGCGRAGTGLRACGGWSRGRQARSCPGRRYRTWWDRGRGVCPARRARGAQRRVMESDPGPGRRLGVDFGEVRVGVALSDPSGILAMPLVTLKRDRPRGTDLDALAALVAEHEVVEVVVGLPRTLAGRDGPAAQAATEYARALASRLGDGTISTRQDKSI